MLKAFMRWLVRRRVEGNIGKWWVPGYDQVVSSIAGIGVVVIYEDILGGVLVGTILFTIFKAIAMVAGYLDVKYIKRFRYELEYTTRLNEFLVGLIKDNRRRHRK